MNPDCCPYSKRARRIWKANGFLVDDHVDDKLADDDFGGKVQRAELKGYLNRVTSGDDSSRRNYVGLPY